MGRALHSNQGLDAADTVHAKIEKQYVGIRFPQFGEGLFSARCRANNLKLGLSAEHTGEAGADDRVVIHD
jgi:hypothetical protein